LGEESFQTYTKYTVDEDRQHTNVHYEQPPRFFLAITGGEWNSYSCNIWEGVDDDTAAQEKKLDLTASLAQIGPRSRILDVGCGWGGPLTYLCHRHGARGVGLTLSSTQKKAADERIARYGVDARVIEQHW